MRTFSFSSGDSGDTGDKAVITVSRRVPTTKRAGGNTADKFTGLEAGFCFSRTVPSSSYASGDTREPRVYWAVPTVPSCPH